MRYGGRDRKAGMVDGAHGFGAPGSGSFVERAIEVRTA
jgi:hypothetical protein